MDYSYKKGIAKLGQTIQNHMVKKPWQVSSVGWGIAPISASLSPFPPKINKNIYPQGVLKIMVKQEVIHVEDFF